MAFKVEEKTIKGNTVTEITYESAAQKITLTTLGASIKRFFAPDRKGNFENIVLTYADDEDYVENTKYLGATVGPYAGRIFPPELFVNDDHYRLESNFMDNVNLHSGSESISRHNFNHLIKDDQTVLFTTVKPAENSRYPGFITFIVTYRFKEDGMEITYETTTDKDTYTNLTNHTYFNLTGTPAKSILDHWLKIPAEKYLVLDEFYVGQSLEDVSGTPFDFREEKPIREAVETLEKSPQKGIDHPFLLEEQNLSIKDETSGRFLSITTDYETVVVYTNNLPTDHLLEQGLKDRTHHAVCLECQHLPNDIHFSKEPASFQAAGTVKKRHIHYKIGTL